MDNYKGIYYKETKEQRYYEGGAHFPYKVLFNILLNLGGTLSQDEYTNNYNNYDLNDNYNRNSKEKNIFKYKTRNFGVNNNIYRNNPNTMIKYPSQNIMNNKENNKKKFISRNDKNGLYNVNTFLNNNKNYVTSINPQYNKKNIDNHLLQILLNKKEKEKHYEEKNNDENSNDNRYSIMNFYKSTHFRNRSEYYTNFEHDKKIKFNNENIQENSKNNFLSSIRNKINLIKSYKNDKYPIEINGKNKEKEGKNEIRNKIINNDSEVNAKYKNKPYLSYFENINKKSRNPGNNNVMEYKNTFENNKNDISGNYTKKFENNYLFKTSDNYNQENIMNNCIKININKEQKNVSNYYGNNIFKKSNTNKQNINQNQTQNNFGIQKYKRKKINQLCCFNQNNGKAKSGNNIFAKNINKINIIHNRNIIK